MNKLIMIFISMITLATMLSCVSPGQLNIPKNNEGKYEYQGVIDIADLSAPQIHDKAKTWMAINFRSAQDVIQLDDRDNGRLIAKGFYSMIHLMHERHIYHTMIVESRDGRIRYTINEFQYVNPGQAPIRLESASLDNGFANNLNSRVASTIASLRAALLAEEDEW